MHIVVLNAEDVLPLALPLKQANCYRKKNNDGHEGLNEEVGKNINVNRRV
jgi:hypothetical protein